MPVYRPWEKEVQGYIRNLRPPARPDTQLMLIGEDSTGIAAVGWTSEVDGVGDVYIEAVAVASRCRGHGGHHADELLTELIDRLAGRAEAAGEDQLLLSCRVHVHNRPAKTLFSRAGAVLTGAFDEEYDEWLLRVDLSRDEASDDARQDQGDVPPQSARRRRRASR